MKNKIYLYFNTITRKLVFITDDPDPIKSAGFSLVKEIEIEGDEFNLARFRWDGTYDDGRLVDLFTEKTAIVTEDEIDKKYYGLFFRKYSLDQVLFNLINCVQFLPETDGYEMQKFLAALLSKKNLEIEKYKTSPNHIYETRDDEKKRIADSFKIQ